jgi:hypothetical protein
MELIRSTHRFAYLRTSVPRGLLELLVRKHNGNQAYALRELRERWQAFVSGMGTDPRLLIDDGAEELWRRR